MSEFLGSCQVYRLAWFFNFVLSRGIIYRRIKRRSEATGCPRAALTVFFIKYTLLRPGGAIEQLQLQYHQIFSSSPFCFRHRNFRFLLSLAVDTVTLTVGALTIMYTVYGILRLSRWSSYIWWFLCPSHNHDDLGIIKVTFCNLRFWQEMSFIPKVCQSLYKDVGLGKMNETSNID